MQICKVRFLLKSTLCLSLLLLPVLAGCGGGGRSLIAISPQTNQQLDAGEELTITASVVNDSSHRGATFSLSGAGSLSATKVSTVADNSFVSVIYTAPATATASTATVTATSGNTPSQTASVSIAINAALVITTASLPAGTVATPYSATLAATGEYFLRWQLQWQ